mmetsp:Transcript_141446/g.200333  ORF Transcript_141446/g.200333 Transcript_141446/m.200333 type:complete len:93 (-) Transcript_141446:14-292(-)
MVLGPSYVISNGQCSQQVMSGSPTAFSNYGTAYGQNYQAGTCASQGYTSPSSNTTWTNPNVNNNHFNSSPVTPFNNNNNGTGPGVGSSYWSS